ncbi:MAG: hypothetical protein ACRECY_20350, partial [Phyllobacterium sp.]
MVRQIEQVEFETHKAWQAGAVTSPPHALANLMRHFGYLLAVFVLSTVLVFTIELVSRGSFADTMRFFQEVYRPAWTTVGFYMLVML